MAGEARSKLRVPLGMGGDPEPYTGRCDEHYYILGGYVHLGRRVTTLPFLFFPES